MHIKHILRHSRIPYTGKGAYSVITIFVITLFVIAVAPEITRSPLSSRKEEGDIAVFECQIRGTPFPVTVISWTKDSRPIDVS